MMDESGGVMKGTLRIERDDVSPWTVLSVVGELDVTTSSALRSAIRDAPADHGVIVDLERVTFVDSTALGVLIAGKKRVERQGRTFGIVVTNELILHILAISGLDEMFDVFESVSRAMAAHDASS